METTITSSAAAQTRRGLGFIVLAAVLWGTVGIASNALFRTATTDPLSVGLFRMLIAAPALWLASYATLGRQMLRVAPRDAGLMLLIGLSMAFYQVCFFAAIDAIGVTISVLVTLCAAPVIVALLEVGFLRERLTRTVLLALVGALAGTVLLVGGGSSVSGDLSQTLRGVALALGSSLAYSVMTLCSRTLAQRYHPLQPMTWGLTASALLLLPFALIAGVALDYSAVEWGLLAYLGLVPTALAFVLFLSGMRYTTATAASVITLLEPLTATLLAWWLFGERLGPWGALGALLLLGAIVLLARHDSAA